MAESGTSTIGRRRVLTAALGGVAGAAAAALATPAAALGATGDVMHVGEDHTATSVTSIYATGTHALYAQTDSGDALRGWTDGAASGVFGFASSSAGYGVYGKNSNRGVAALGTYGAALWASNVGWAAPLAMDIEGPAQFSRSGVIKVRKGVKRFKLPVVATTRTFAIATMQSYRSKMYVRCVIRSGTAMYGYFNIPATSGTYVAWIAFEKP